MASIEKRTREGHTIWRAHYRTPPAPNATRPSPARSMPNGDTRLRA